MRAAILAIGTELLGTDRLDTNSLRLTETLEHHGIPLVTKAVAGDDESEIAQTIAHLLTRADLLLITGGLGPTADDVTRQAVAHALGRDLHHDPEILSGIEAKFASFGMRMPEVNRRQAEVVDGATILANPRGTAPGLHLDDDRGTLFLFPGVPTELEGMITADLEPWLAQRSGGVGRERGVVKVASLPESTVEERIAPAYDDFGRENVSVLAKAGEIRVQFWASGAPEERRERLAAMAARLRELLGDAVFTDRGDEDLAAVVGELLRGRGESVASAESCTGGWLGRRITAVSGSSDYYPGGVVSYSNPVKEQLLGVPAALLAEHGAVSEPVAVAMACGVRERLGATYGLGITGVAGPSGGSDAKPVGTVHLALAGPAADDAGSGGGSVLIEHRRVRFPGDRERVRWMSTQLALEMLRRHLLGLPSIAVGGRGGTTGAHRAGAEAGVA
jgi:nicotinamide-nucleotide amidase